MIYIIYFLFFYLFIKLFCNFKNNQESICDNQIIFITGGSSGIGLEIAKEYSNKNNKICIFSRNEEKLKKAKEQILNCTYFSTDVSDFDSVKKSFDLAKKMIGIPNTLILSTGSANPDYFLDQDIEYFQNSIQLNYMGVVNCIKCILPDMLKIKNSNICIISSAAALVSFIGYTSYSPTKYALRGLSDALRNELIGFDINISIAYPPDTDTPGFKLENKKKPIETVMCAPTSPYSPNQVAKTIIKGISNKDYHILSSDYFQNLLIFSMNGITPRKYLIFEIMLLPFIAISQFFILKWFDYQAYKYFKKKEN